MENVSESPSASLAVMVIVTEWSSSVDALVSLATGGVLQTGSADSPAGNDGAAGEHTPVVCAGQVPTGAPLVGNEEPARLIEPQAVMEIIPCEPDGSPEPEPVGRTSPTPLVQITLPEYERTEIVPPPREALLVFESPMEEMTA